MKKYVKSLIVILLFSVPFILSTFALAGDVVAGKAKSASCSSCHGRDGKSVMRNNPNLAGQKQAYLIKAMKDYRGGQRKDAMMNALAASLSDNDIENLAAFYASVK
jgi:cytochrome c553